MADSNEESRNHQLAVEEAREPFPEEAEEPSARRRARSYFQQHPAAKWVLLLFFAALIIGGILVWRYYAARESTDDAQVDAHIAPISARVGGTVIKVNVDDNMRVKTGDVLVQLDPKDYQVAVAQAKANLADAIAGHRAARTTIPITHTSTSSSLDMARANLGASEKEVNAAQARLREAEANYTKAAQDLERMRQLVAKDEVSRQQYDTAVAAEQSARATVDVARAAVATAISHVTQAEAQVRGAQTAPQQVAVTEARAGAAGANVEQRQAQVDQALLNLEYTTIKAPVDGIVSKRNVEPGQVVQPGQPLMSLVNLGDIWVTANYKETQLEKMRVGQKATIHVDAFSRDYQGHVDSIGGGTGARFSLLPPENATGNYVKVVQRIPVKIVFESGQDLGGLRPGMSVTTTVLLK
ncbi:MAG: HlyD family secretion protein [Terriglobales bacterium]